MSFFNGWESLLRVPLIGILAYAGMVAMMRVSGNRTLSKMNSFEFVVTIAFGSTIAAILTNRNVSLAEGLAAIALLVLLQFVVTWLSVRFPAFACVVKTPPKLLVREGSMLRENMKIARVTEGEICAVIRRHGLGGIEQVAAIVLEADGSMSVIGEHRKGSLNTLEGVDDKP